LGVGFNSSLLLLTVSNTLYYKCKIGF